ncbi:RPM1-interacting protein 4 [Linum perenne]
MILPLPAVRLQFGHLLLRFPVSRNPLPEDCSMLERFEKRRKDRERLKQEKRKKKKEKRNNNNSRSNSDGKSLPRFGEWDESDPSAADGYSAIFDIVRKEKNSSSHGLCAGNLTFKLTDQIKTRRRSRLKRFIKSLKVKFL